MQPSEKQSQHLNYYKYLKPITMSKLEITITILFATAIIILIVWDAKDKKYKWHENDVIPEPMPMNEYVSGDIIIRDLTTEKEIKGYFDHQRQHFVDYNGNMVSGDFIWRYLSF